MSSAAGAGPKASARIALLGVDAASAAVLTDCFRQFGIETDAVAASETESLAETYSACVVPLNAEAEPLLRGIRKSSHRIVVYGTCGSTKEALRYSEYGINAVFHTPLNKQEAALVVRATHLLVLKELRRYVRVPLVCAVTLETGKEKLEGTSLEISAGGMCLSTNGHIAVSETVTATFALPGIGKSAVRSVMCWLRRDERMAAIRFDPSDPKRDVVRRWIDEYLGA